MEARLIGGVHLEHPSAVDRERGVKSTTSLSVSRGLKSGKLDHVPLDEDDLLRLIEDAAKALRILRGRS